MPAKFNVYQEDLFCWYCHETYENKKELEIHSFIHSAWGEEIVPIFNLIKVNKDTIIEDVNGKTEKHSTDFQPNTDSASDHVSEFSLLNNVEESTVKYNENDYAISNAVKELDLGKSKNENAISKICESGNSLSREVKEVNFLEDNEENRIANSFDIENSVSETENELNLLKHNVEEENVKNCDTLYATSNRINELNSLKNSIDSSDSGYSSPAQASPEEA